MTNLPKLLIKDLVRTLGMFLAWSKLSRFNILEKKNSFQWTPGSQASNIWINIPCIYVNIQVNIIYACMPIIFWYLRNLRENVNTPYIIRIVNRWEFSVTKRGGGAPPPHSNYTGETLLFLCPAFINSLIDEFIHFLYKNSLILQ